MHLGLKQLAIILVLVSAITALGQEADETRSYPYAEPADVADIRSEDPLASYIERRSTWGALVTLGYSTYDPQDYDPDFTAADNYSDFYGIPETPLVEFTVSAKLNFSFMSVSADMGAGYFQNQGNLDSSLTLIPIRLGGTLALDGIFSEPYLVPYGSAGAYTVMYTEKLASQKVEGRTAVAPYFTLGARIQLDWIDDETDVTGFVEHGLQNTYLFVEARYFAATGARVPDLGSPEEQPYQLGAGLSLEF